MAKHKLTKSTFLSGGICRRSLWLYKHRRDLIPATSAEQQFVFDKGHEVGKLAQQLYPSGVDASPVNPFDYQSSTELTAKLISEGGQLIYEAAFQYNGVFAALDILVKKADGWYGYEVKSSTKVHDINVTDSALQYWVMAGCGIELKDISIVHLNSEYERHGELEVEKLFKTESVTYLVLALQDKIRGQVAELKKVVESKTEPNVLIGRQCSNPYTCDFKEHCWQDVPEESILDFTYYRKTEERFKLYHSGIKRIADIEDWKALKPPYDSVVEMHVKRGIYIDPDNFKAFMDTLQFPLRFMDFETVSFALPPFDKSSPYDQMSFQYSLHTMGSEDAELTHSAFLADPSTDFREEFIRSLLNDLGDTGSIIVWNIGFERSKLNALVLLYPQYEERINAVIVRLIDLAIPFQKKWVYHYSLSCSYSIKNVLPFVAPALSYDKLSVNNGLYASQLFQQMMVEPGKDWTKERNDLLEYCCLDTYSMVMVYRFLTTL